MFCFNELVGGTNLESLAEDNTSSAQFAESNLKQFGFQNGTQNLNDVNMFHGSAALENDCLWLHSSSGPFSEDTLNSTYHVTENVFFDRDPSLIDGSNHTSPIWPHVNCHFIHDSAPDYNPTQLPQPVHQQLVMPLHHTTQPYQRCVMARNHRAQISLVPTSTGKFKAVVKRKRKRTIFTTEQIEALEQYFTKKPYVTREDRQFLVNQLQLNDKAVKIWFQNRRLKGKRANEHPSSGNELIEECSSPDLRLDYMESQINQKTDEFGFVTLDDTLMGNLVNVIDSVISNKCTSDRPPEEATAIVSSPIYEPISPADCTIEEDSPMQWNPFEPKESLQRLFDLQAMLPL